MPLAKLTRNRRRRRLPQTLLLAACAGLAAGGCGGVNSGRLVDYLDELEFDVPLETATYVMIGRYDIPITASHTPNTGSKYVQQVGEKGLVWMRLQFELAAETTTQHEQAVTEAAERHRGAINDAVLTVVRTSSVDELADPRLAALNARISEVARPILGEARVRQLVFNDPQSVAERQKREEEATAKSHGGHGDGHDGGHDGGHAEGHSDGDGEPEQHSADGHGDDHGADHDGGEHAVDSHGSEAHGSDENGRH